MATILVADDEKLLCDLLQVVFTRHGHEVLIAPNGREAVEIFRTRRPRITFLDVHMPEMNGIEALKQIRAIDPDAAVIMITGDRSDKLENEARQLGVTDFLGKGLAPDVLFRAIEREVAKRSQAPSASRQGKGSGAGTRNRNSLLVVDDDPSIRNLVREFLTLRGYRVRVAQDGKEALALVEQERPHLIILDLNMPGMNGIEVLRALRARDFKGGVVMLSVSQDEHALQQTMDLGAVDVMGKPVELERLELVVQVALAVSID
jgi:DNA-binding response OmpR family regulator